jgi:DNA repair protein RecN (Recombination protein N)
VVPLTEAGRLDEIARMLAGETVTEAAREAARVLLSA